MVDRPKFLGATAALAAVTLAGGSSGAIASSAEQRPHQVTTSHRQDAVPVAKPFTPDVSPIISCEGDDFTPKAHITKAITIVHNGDALNACGPDFKSIEAAVEETVFDENECPAPIARNDWNNPDGTKVVIYTLPTSKMAISCYENLLPKGRGGGGSGGGGSENQTPGNGGGGGGGAGGSGALSFDLRPINPLFAVKR